MRMKEYTLGAEPLHTRYGAVISINLGDCAVHISTIL